jgi:hypothetical protein
MNLTINAALQKRNNSGQVSLKTELWLESYDIYSDDMSNCQVWTAA